MCWSHHPFATDKIDAGDILSQVRPSNISISDDCHDIGCKAIICGVDAMADAISKLELDKLKLTKQINLGEIYRDRDFGPDDVLKMWKNLENGMIQNYLDNQTQLNLKFPIY
jgi:hypothetical protein